MVSVRRLKQLENQQGMNAVRQRWMSLGSRALMLVGVAMVACGCGESGPPRKQTFKVTGTILVDGGAPSSPLQIRCQSATGLDQAMPTISQAISQEGGAFEIATYEAGDGVPPGEYIITLKWQEFNPLSMSYGGPDRLGGRYEDPKTSTIRFTVADQPVDLGELQVTTK
jgi:hypothetical protein